MAKKDKCWYAEEIKNRSTLTYNFRSSTPGCNVIEAVWNNNPCPIGNVWFRHIGKSMIEILSSYVINHYRRLGVRTYLHEKLIEAYPNVKVFITAEGTKKSIPWLKKMGFKQNKIDGWRKKIK